MRGDAARHRNLQDAGLCRRGAGRVDCRTRRGRAALPYLDGRSGGNVRDLPPRLRFHARPGTRAGRHHCTGLRSAADLGPGHGRAWPMSLRITIMPGGGITMFCAVMPPPGMIVMRLRAWPMSLRITIMPGGGITAQNIVAIADATG